MVRPARRGAGGGDGRGGGRGVRAEGAAAAADAAAGAAVPGPGRAAAGPQRPEPPRRCQTGFAALPHARPQGIVNRPTPKRCPTRP